MFKLWCERGIGLSYTILQNQNCSGEQYFYEFYTDRVK